MKKVLVNYSGWGEHWPLGHLADNGQQILFEFDPIALKKKLELSPLNLPLAPQTYGNFPAHLLRLPGLIYDCLPDGWGLLVMDKLFRKIGLTGASPLDRLSFLGERALGALTFEPVREEGQPGIKPLALARIARESQKIIRGEASSALPQLALLGGSPHGARPKVLVNYDAAAKQISTDPNGAGDPWLIKFQAMNEHKEACATEALYALLARHAGLSVSETTYFDLGKNLAAFGTKRFDRELKPRGRRIRVPVHTMAGALHADFRVPSTGYTSLLRLTLRMTHDQREVYKAFRQCAFNVIFHNRDDHTKNFSFRLSQNQEWKLSPAYDLTFNHGPGGEHQMDICGEGRAPGREHLLALALDSGLKRAECLTILEEVKAAASTFTSEAKQWPIRKATVAEMAKAIAGNLKRT